MIATMGGRFGGYGLYLLKGKPVLPIISSIWSGTVGKAGSVAETGSAEH